MRTQSESQITFGTFLRFIGVVSLIVLLILYVQFQARFFLQGPVVTMTDTHEVVHHERFIVLSGNTQNIVKLTVNGKEIHTNEAGAFSHTLFLEKGYTITEINAQDRFGRTTSLRREYVFLPNQV